MANEIVRAEYDNTKPIQVEVKIVRYLPVSSDGVIYERLIIPSHIEDMYVFIPMEGSMLDFLA